MLVSKHPDTLKFGKWLDNFSEHKSSPAFSIGDELRFRAPLATKRFPGPGHYRVDRDWPENEEHEFSSQAKTGTILAPKYSMPLDDRCAADGTLKGIARPSQCRVGPGHYEGTRMGMLTSQRRFVAHTFPKSVESAEALRERKKRSNNPGPDRYNLVRAFDDGGKEKSGVTERAVRRGTGCWAASQYSHIFSCLKPKEQTDGRSMSLPTLNPNLVGGKKNQRGGAAGSSPGDPSSDI